MALKRLPSAQLEEESRLALQSVVNEVNCQFRRLIPDNSGIDGEIELVRGTTLTGKILKCQIKAGRGYLTSETDDHLKIRLERRYLDHWASMEIPVLLFYYDPILRVVYWKSIQDYLKLHRNLLNQPQQSFSIPFDKSRDVFTSQSLGDLWLVANKEFGYSKITYSEGQPEEIASNWFRAVSVPQIIYAAPTTHAIVGNVTSQVQGLYACVTRPERLYTFSSLFDEAVELRTFCKGTRVDELRYDDIDHTLYVDLLNQVIRFNLGRSQLMLLGERYHFSLSLLSDPANNIFAYPGLKGQPEERKKIYISPEERKHHALKLKFHRLSSDWFLEIEPCWYFSYPPKVRKSREEIGARITREMADTMNKDYLYLLHFWRQFLSNNTSTMIFPCDSTPAAQQIVVDAVWLSSETSFRLVNDYEGPVVRKGSSA